MTSRRILVVDDDESLRRVTQVQLEQAGYRVATAPSGPDALRMMGESPYDLVITDLRMPGMSGIELLNRIRSEHPGTAVVMFTAFGSVDSAVEAMRAGAYDYITKPVHPEQLTLVVKRSLDHLNLLEEVRLLRSSLDDKYGFENIIGHSTSLLYLLDMAARASQTDATVLIQGETGTGKELLAKAVHFNSKRRERPFVTINCGAIPKDLLESELFGHVKGSFTGAIAHKKGKVESADGGTLFLDEIGEMPLELQVKVLRLIQQGEIEKVGAPEPGRVDIRVIAATHRNLLAMAEDGAFREDLYYRLSVIPLELPPLRERLDDVPELLGHFFEKLRRKHGRANLSLPAVLAPYFVNYRWPGNIRELENIVERIIVLARGTEVALEDLPEFLRHERPIVETLNLDLPSQGISLEAIEKELILRALVRFQWNQTHAARYLDVSRKALMYRMEKHGIRRPDSTGAAGEESDPS
ncbi:MAG: sigma-54-dependent Fis family transcriptional regulator [Bryobacterales bacterium]|nr:sigma-54-dependent Fis family transcriptional regulator [Bryobacterales bacterium]